jgi:hypothetical protein
MTTRYCTSRAGAVARFEQRARRHFHLRRFAKGRYACGIQSKASRRAAEEFSAESAFEIRYPPRDLGSPQFDRAPRAGQRSVAGEGCEDPDVFPVERAICLAFRHRGQCAVQSGRRAFTVSIR